MSDLIERSDVIKMLESVIRLIQATAKNFRGRG